MTPQETGFLNRSLNIGNQTYRYAVYVPRDFDSSRRWPVILFLHGSGERGSDGLKPTQVGIGTAIRFNPDRIPAIVVFPQAPDDRRWLDEPADAAMMALDRAVAEFNGDPSRVYLTGLSMGGYGCWHLALAHPDRFAALVVVCGGLLPHEAAKSVRQSPLTMNVGDPYAFTARALRRIPISLYHGSDDGLIPPSESQQMAEALRSEGAEVRYTEYPGVGHNSWDLAYGESKLWSWLFAQQLTSERTTR
jgi:predicted peptidase